MAGYESDVQKERDMKDRFMAQHPESPFRIITGASFHGLRYFPVDPSYRVPAVMVRSPRPEEAVLRTNRGGELTCRYVGDMVFSLDGQEHRLRVFHAGEQVGPSVFVPFRDATCGNESYGPGRYLIFQLSEDDHYTIDFNLAFNPYCAYTDGYECGYPPAENDLPVAVRAGEMAWDAGEAADLSEEEEADAPARTAPKRVPAAPAKSKARAESARPKPPAPKSPTRAKPASGPKARKRKK